MKVCRKCGGAKPLDEFYAGKARCKTCVASASRARYWAKQAERPPRPAVPRNAKLCRQCGVVKPIVEFYGGLRACKECVSAYGRAFRATPERQAYMRAYRQSPEAQARARVARRTPEYKAWQREYNAGPGGKAAQRRYLGTPKARARDARLRARWPQKIKARRAVCDALRSGRLVRLPCEVCGSLRSEAHHPDYSKPLDVIWLCRHHHRLADAAQAAGQPMQFGAASGIPSEEVFRP